MASDDDDTARSRPSRLRRVGHALWARFVALVLVGLCLATATCLLPGLGRLVESWSSSGAQVTGAQAPQGILDRRAALASTASTNPRAPVSPGPSTTALPVSPAPTPPTPQASPAGPGAGEAQLRGARSLVLLAGLVVALFLVLGWPQVASSGATTLLSLLLLSWFAAGAARQWSSRSPGLVVSLACMAALGWLFVHLAYLVALYVQSALEGDHDNNTGLLGQLLPSQRAMVDTLTKLILGEAEPCQPTVISLRGAWGSGKSTIVAGLVAELRRNHARRAVVVHVDAWQHQADANLEQALFRAIAARPELLWPRAWLAYPVFSEMLFLFFKAVRLSMVRGGLKAELDSRSTAPPVIWWRRRLRQLIEPAARAGRRIVVVLDEVDRCEPLAAQAFLTLVPRFLLMPGMVVVVPTVRQQVGFKVFTPLTACLPDLRSTMDAVLYAELAPERRAELHAELHAALPSDGRASAQRAALWGAANAGVLQATTQPASAAEASGPGAARPSSSEAGTASCARALDAALLRQYLRLGDLERRRLAFMFAEKFFASTPVYIPPLTADDVRGVLERFHGVRQALAGYGLTADEHTHLGEWAASEWLDGLAHVNDTFGSLRQLQGALAANLNDFAQRLRTPGVPDCDALTAAQLAVTLAIRAVVFGRLAATP